MSVLGRALQESSTAVRTVFGNSNLRRIMLAFGGSLIGDWAYATAISVWAFGVGGAKVLAVWAVVRFLLMAVCTPFAATFVDRYSRKRIMVGVDVARCLLLLGIAAGMATLDPVVVFVLAGIVSVLGTPFRPAQRAMLPSLVSKPEELTAVNGTSSTLESLALGPPVWDSCTSVVLGRLRRVTSRCRRSPPAPKARAGLARGRRLVAASGLPSLL